MSISKRIKQLRIEFDLTQQQLADIVKSPKQRITDIEVGKVKNLKGKELEELEAHYNINPTWLLNGKGQMIVQTNHGMVVKENHGVMNMENNIPKEINEIIKYLYQNVPLGQTPDILELIKKHVEDNT